MTGGGVVYVYIYLFMYNTYIDFNDLREPLWISSWYTSSSERWDFLKEGVLESIGASELRWPILLTTGS